MAVRPAFLGFCLQISGTRYQVTAGSAVPAFVGFSRSALFLISEKLYKNKAINYLSSSMGEYTLDLRFKIVLIIVSIPNQRKS